jgi:hypothetical protein
MKHLLTAVALLFTVTSPAWADTIILYGDQDGFGVGATSFKSTAIDSAGPGEAAGTDIRLIGTGLAAPAFQPTATISFGALADITGITITMSMAEFGGNINPVNGPNSIVTDGVAVPVAFLDSFSSFAIGANPNIETKSMALPAAFFPLFADGSINLTGSRITERLGFGSFQIDYIRFDVATATSVPEPTPLVLTGIGFAAITLASRRKTNVLVVAFLTGEKARDQ